MALNIRVDLEKTYAIKTISKNQELRSFQTVLRNGERLKLGIRISDEMHPIIPNVYNFSFGPFDHYNLIDDKARAGSPGSFQSIFNYYSKRTYVPEK